MQRLQKIGHVTPKNAAQVRSSRLGIGFEKLDRDVFDPEKAYDKVAALGVKWVRIQSGWQRTEREKGVYSFAWLDSIVDQLIVRGLRPWICLCYGNGLYDENAAKIFGAVGVPPIFTQESAPHGAAMWRRWWSGIGIGCLIMKSGMSRTGAGSTGRTLPSWEISPWIPPG